MIVRRGIHARGAGQYLAVEDGVDAAADGTRLPVQPSPVPTAACAFKLLPSVEGVRGHVPVETGAPPGCARLSDVLE